MEPKNAEKKREQLRRERKVESVIENTIVRRVELQWLIRTF